MSIIKLPYEPRKRGKKGVLDEGLVNYLLSRFSTSEMTILDPFAGEKTIEKCGRKLFRQVISLDIQQGQDARKLPFEHDSTDLIVTHPPYWNAIKYTEDKRDLSNASTYEEFLKGFDECLGEMSRVLKKHGRLILILGDYRKKGKLYSLHSDVIKDAWIHNLKLKAIWVHEISAGSAPHISSEFQMSHDYVIVLEKE